MQGTVCVLYGFGEGPAIGKKLVAKLKQSGFEITSDASQADYIIAHSGGIIYLPKTYKAKLFLLIGVNDKIDDSFITMQYKKVKQDFVHAVRSKKHWYWLKKSWWNLFYLFQGVKRTKHMWKIAHNGGPFIPDIKNAKVIIITYKEDPWSESLTKKDLEKFPGYELINRDGVHDDLWLNSDYYIKLLHLPKV